MTLRRSSDYKTIIRNINRCFNSDVEIELFFDTYVDIDNHKHAFFSQVRFVHLLYVSSLQWGVGGGLTKALLSLLILVLRHIFHFL